MAPHTDLGRWGEDFIANLLHQATGVRPTPGIRADLNFGGAEIEVKTAKPSDYNGNNKGYQFCILRKGHTRLKAPILILICVRLNDINNPDVFVIPARHIRPNRHKITLPLDTANYQGQWARFRWALQLIADYADQNRSGLRA